MLEAEAGDMMDEDPEEETEEDPEEESDNEELNDNPEKEREKNVIEETVIEIGIGNATVNTETSRRLRKSRWETPQTEKTSKRRKKSRWDEIDTERGSLDPHSPFIYPLELPMDPQRTRTLIMKLTEINMKLRKSEFHDDRPAEERSPSPDPIYNNLGIRINTREVRIRRKLNDQKKSILSELAGKTNNSTSTPKMTRFTKKLLIPVKKYPTYNFVGLVLGPKGITQKKMEKETGTRIYVRGEGSGDPGTEGEDLHVLVDAPNIKSLNSAVAMIEKLLIPVDDVKNEHKRAQLMELAKMKGNYKDHYVCEVCKEKGHKYYACPLQESTFKADWSGSFRNLTSSCGGDGLSKNVDPANLYVCHLPPVIDDRRLKEFFSPFGGIEGARVVRDVATGLSRGFGFVKFEDPSDAAVALKYMDGFKMEGHVLGVRVAELKTAQNPLIQTSSIYPKASLPLRYNYNAIDVARTEGVNVPTYVATELVRMSTVSSAYDFCDRIKSSVTKTVSRFPGDPDYPGSQFKNEAQYQMMPEIEGNSSFWGGNGLPLYDRFEDKLG